MYYDLLARIKNGYHARKELILAPYSNFDFAVAKVLDDSGYVQGAVKRVMGKRTMLEVKMKYDVDGAPSFTDFKLLSKPSRHMYKGKADLRPVKQNYGMAVLSTSSGVMSNKEARKKNVGGEYLFEIW